MCLSFQETNVGKKAFWKKTDRKTILPCTCCIRPRSFCRLAFGLHEQLRIRIRKMLVSMIRAEVSKMYHHLPARTIPCWRHFLKRQNWHRFRWALLISQLPSASQLYTRLFCTVLLKKPYIFKNKFFVCPSHKVKLVSLPDSCCMTNSSTET